jgi:peptidyl-prolyl cis-trans isomerase C
LKALTPLVLFAVLVAGCSKTPAQSNASSGNTTPGVGQSAAPASAPASATPSSGAAQASAQAPGQPPAAPPAKPVPATLPDVVAKVNGEAISKAEFEDAVKSMETQAGRPVPAEERDQVFRAVLNQLVTGHVLLQESRSRKVAVVDADVDGRLNQLRQRFPSEDEFKKALASRNLTPEKVRDEIKKQLAIEKMIEAEVTPQISVTDHDVKDFYDKNPQQFQQPESWRASHILVMVPQDAAEAQKKEARAKIDDVLKQVKAGGDFAELAKKYSQDGSAQAGGDLNYFSKGQMVKPFEDAVSALKVGEVSGVVETQFGFHVIKLTDKRAPRTVPLTEVNKKIGDYLLNRMRNEKAGAFVESLKAKSRIEVLI